MTTTLTRIPEQWTEGDLAALAETALRAITTIDTTNVHAAYQDGAVLLVGRVQWSSEAEAIGDTLRRVPAFSTLHNRIGFHYDDDPHGRAWGHTEHAQR